MKPLDVGDHIRLGDGPQGRLRVRSMIPDRQLVDVMNAYGQMDQLTCGVALAYRVEEES